MDCLYEWWWAVYPFTDVASAIDALAPQTRCVVDVERPFTDVASAIDALAHPLVRLVRWCLLNAADHPPCAETLAHLHAAL